MTRLCTWPVASAFLLQKSMSVGRIVLPQRGVYSPQVRSSREFVEFRARLFSFSDSYVMVVHWFRGSAF